MGEYLDGLPYQSRLMSLDEDSWSRMGVGDKQAIINDFKSRIALYKGLNAKVARWVRSPEGPEPGAASIPGRLDRRPCRPRRRGRRGAGGDKRERRGVGSRG